MNTLTNQSPCKALALYPEGTFPGTGADFEALARYGRCLRSAAMFGAARRFAGRLRRGFRSAQAAFRNHQRRRRAVAELSRLDDHLLADIGVRREQIPRLVDGPMQRPDSERSAGAAKRGTPGAVVTHRRVIADRAANDVDCRRRAA